MRNLADKIDLDEVLERFEEFGPGAKTSDYLGVSEEEMKDAVDWFVSDLKDLGYSPRNGPYGPKVLENFDLNYDKMDEILEEFHQEVQENAMSGFSFQDFIADPMGTLKKQSKSIPRRITDRTVEFLKREGYEEVSLEKWVQADLFMKWNFESKMNEKMSNRLQSIPFLGS